MHFLIYLRGKPGIWCEMRIWKKKKIWWLCRIVMNKIMVQWITREWQIGLEET